MSTTKLLRIVKPVSEVFLAAIHLFKYQFTGTKLCSILHLYTSRSMLNIANAMHVDQNKPCI